MKKQNALPLVTMLFVVVLIFGGCTKVNPVSADLGQNSEGCTKENPGQNAIPSLQFVRMPPTLHSLCELISAVSPVTVAHGGILRLDYEQSDSTGKKVFDLHTELKFDHRSVSNDFMASLSMDAYYFMTAVDLVFGPHGSAFLKPAHLKVHVKGLDLSGYSDSDDLHLYYDNNGTWERMEGNVKLNVKEGEITCDDGLLPHFSRYAFGR